MLVNCKRTLPCTVIDVMWIPLALRSDTEAAVGVAERNGQADFGTTLAQRGNRKTTRQKLIGNLEEATRKMINMLVNMEANDATPYVKKSPPCLPATVGDG